MWLADRRSVVRLLAAAPMAGLASVSKALPSDALVVPTLAGVVHGAAVGGLRVFTGIPFGQAARLARPRPASRWQGVFDATRPAKLAPQASGMVTFPAETSEDCLQLNVWAPMTPGHHPVLVYIHGGANETGWSGDVSTAGDRFAAHDVVCVTVNYRLGAFGFLEAGALLGPAYRGSGNNGMRDLLLALQWVRSNIAAFGGDPDRVTISGESAGGKNVGTLIGMPTADQLYRAAAIFSGGAETIYTMAQADDFARLFVRKLGGVKNLLTSPAHVIVAAQQEAKTAWPRNFPYRPVVDGDLLPAPPLERIRNGRAPQIPLLIGSNADESRLFLLARQAGQPLEARMIANDTAEHLAVIDQRYAAEFPDLTPADRHWRLLTAEEYGLPGLRIAEAHAACGAQVYRYRLDYPAPGGPFKGRTPHVLDVPFTFDHVAVPSFTRFFGLTPADQSMADRMHAAVVTFVCAGRPEAASLPVWPRFDIKTRFTMMLDANPRIVSDPDRAERMLW